MIFEALENQPDREKLANERAYFNLETNSQILNWNTGFTLTPTNYDGQRAVLMIHGFLGSPYFMHGFANIYLDAGYQVRAIRLPGHGSSPRALEHISLLHWQSEILTALSELSHNAKEIHLCGFSLGALLGCLIDEFDISSHVMIAPPFGISPLSLVAEILYYMGLHNGYAITRKATPTRADNKVMYGEYPLSILHVITQAIALFHKREKALANEKCLMVISTEDGVVSTDKIMKFFKANKNPESQMRLYSKRTIQLEDSRITSIDATSFGSHIESISHVAYPIAPSDPYFGENGEYYGDLPPETVFGAAGTKTAFRKNFKRLLYNPDFEGLVAQLKQFIC